MQNKANSISNIGNPQNEFYDLFLRVTEIDLENIKIVSGTGTAIELISPPLVAIIDTKVDDLSSQDKLRP